VVISTLAPQVNAAPSLTPTIYDPTAPDPQKCPGYIGSNVLDTPNGLTADLVIAGPNCQAFGNDIADLTLEVQYQTKERLNVRIYPKYLSDSNETRYLLSPDLVPQPEADGRTGADSSDLKLDWSNEPTFQFKISRRSDGEVLFSSYGYKLVYEDQYLELKTSMVQVSGLTLVASGDNSTDRLLLYRTTTFTA
jgi:alpha-glucosidase